jgi:beta-xylosidase
MIIYDDDPRIQAVMKAALDRHKDNMQDYEQYVKKAEDKHREINNIKDQEYRKRRQTIERQREEMRAMLE